MSIHAVAETTLVTKDAEVIADMAAAVLASIARIHADGLVAVSSIAAPVPVRLALPPVAEVGTVLIQDGEPVKAELIDLELVDAELVDAELVDAELVEEPVGDAEPVVRIAEPVWIAPRPRGRHVSPALTHQLPARRAA